MTRAVMVMYDSLNRRMLPPFGAEETRAPHFTRLAEHSVTFDTCYAGSMPCMPARREMHTGRHNFLHRSWGPLEPFDDSVPQMLTEAGVHTHLATDHQHYWEDGGATYHNRYSTYELLRGQEGDRWKGHINPPERGDSLNWDMPLATQDRVNRLYLADERDHPQTLTFDAGVHFIETNAAEDDWFVQIETFDPHEPFFTYDHYRELYGKADPEGAEFDWPAYRRVIETDHEVARARQNYLALLTQCDRSLGRVLDLFDTHDLWRDTMLIVCTDHGFFLGERGWWGKSVQPWFDETIHTPLFVWDPRTGVRNERRDALVQTIDLGPTLLDFFGLEPTDDMQGRSLAEVIGDPSPTDWRAGGLFGSHGGHVSVTDGRHVYMRASIDESNAPLNEYTLMPTHMRARFDPRELHGAELTEPFSFTKGAPTLKVAGQAMSSPYTFGTLLYDLESDPHQSEPLRDPELELELAQLLVDCMRANDAPAEQFQRLGLPVTGAVTPEHLLIEAQWAQVQASQAHAPRRHDFADDDPVRVFTLASVLADSGRRAALGDDFVSKLDGMSRRSAGATLLEVMAVMPSVGPDEATAINEALKASYPESGDVGTNR